MANRILVTPRFSGKSNPEPAILHKARGYKLVMNSNGRITFKEELIAHGGDVDGIIAGVDQFGIDVPAAASRPKAVEYVELDGSLEQSDFIGLRAPLNPAPRNMPEGAQSALMESTAVLVSTSRGGIIVEDEPPGNKEFLKLGNIVTGSHRAASTVEAVGNMGAMSARNLICSPGR